MMNDKKKERHEALWRARQWHVDRKTAAAAPTPRKMSEDEKQEAKERARQWAENRRSTGLAHDEVIIDLYSNNGLKTKRSEYNNVQDLIKFGVVFQSNGKQLYPGLRARPDGDIATSPYSAINWENDERGHISYPSSKESQRMKDVNSRRPKERGKVWIRQHPITLRRSSVQTAQNKQVASWLRYYITTDLGQREDRAGGRRVLVFVGFKHQNPHVCEALIEKSKGYWDEVRLIDSPQDGARQLLMMTMVNDSIRTHQPDQILTQKSSQAYIHTLSSAISAAAAGGQGQPLDTQATTATAVSMMITVEK